MKLSDCRGIVEAVNEACSCGGAGPGEGCPACEVWHAIKDFEFADDTAEGPAACVAEALQPRDASPELAEAESAVRKVLGSCSKESALVISSDRVRTIAAELDRLRRALATAEAEVERLKLEEPRCYRALLDLRDAARDCNVDDTRSIERLNRAVADATKVLDGAPASQPAPATTENLRAIWRYDWETVTFGYCVDGVPLEAIYELCERVTNRMRKAQPAPAQDGDRATRTDECRTCGYAPCACDQT